MDLGIILPVVGAVVLICGGIIGFAVGRRRGSRKSWVNVVAAVATALVLSILVMFYFIAKTDAGGWGGVVTAAKRTTTICIHMVIWPLLGSAAISCLLNRGRHRRKDM